MSATEKVLLIVLLTINLAAFILFALDKSYAKKQKRRIPEFTLLAISVCFGALGGLLGMVLLNHKTNYRRHRDFVLVVPLALVIQLAVLYVLFPK